MLEVCSNCKYINYRGQCPILREYKNMTGDSGNRFYCKNFKAQED